MSDGLQESSVDIPLAPMSQTPAKHGGPLGRLQSIKNMEITHYAPSQGAPSRLKAEPRGAFVSLSTDTRDPDTGDVSSVSWENPELFESLGQQALSICNAVPRVYNGDDAFIAYDKKRVITNKLDEDVFHTSDRTIQAPDSAKADGITCSVWAERLSPANTSVSLFVGFKGSDGAWIRPPVVIYDPHSHGDGAITMARVVTDGIMFWVVHNAIVSSVDKYRVHLFNTRGQELDTDDSVAKNWTGEPGYWDIIARTGGGMILAQSLGANSTSGDGVAISRYTQSAGTISVSSANDATVHCRGPLAWSKNNLDSNYYLAVVGNAEDAGGKLWGYRFPSGMPAAQNHEFDFDVNIPGEARPDALVPYVKANTDPMATVPDLVVAYTVLSLTPQAVGPVYDPALRYIQIYSCDFNDLSTFIGQKNSVCLVSRAFEHDGEWYAFTYYQSGSGLSVMETQVNIDAAGGDYMIGWRDQPIDVRIGDLTKGASKTFVCESSYINVPLSPVGIDGSGTPDSVLPIRSSGLSGIPDGTLLLQWTFKNLTAIPVIDGGRMVIAGNGNTSVNGSWEFIYALSSHVFLTEPVSVGGIFPVTGNLASGGTVEMISMTTYQIREINDAYSTETQGFLDGGTMLASGSNGIGFNGTFTIARAFANNRYALGGAFFRGIRVVTTTQVAFGTAPVTCVCHPVGENDWIFADGEFTDVLTDVPHKLEVSGTSFDLNGNIINNDLEYSIIDVVSASEINTDGSEITAQVFNTPLPSVSIHVPLDVDEFTFNLQNVTLDYSYNGALVFVHDSPIASNNGLYKISFIDTVNNTFIAKPADGRTGQRSMSFPTEGLFVTIFLSNNIQPIFQPKWFMTPLFDTETAHVGRFEDGLAYADWRYEGDSFLGPNNFPLHVSTVNDVANAKQVLLPYRARSFTAGQSLVTPSNQVADASVTIFQSTVGLKEFTLSDECGTASAMSNELFIPGPLASVFTSSGFREQGINVSPEAPFMVTQETISEDVHITPATSHQIVVTYEVTDENGNRIFCPPSPALDYSLTGTNNCATYGGRLPIPFDSSGKPIAKRHGLTNHRIVGIIISRTSYQGDIPTIQHYKITDDLNVNGLAPVSDLNTSGFSFPDEFTWNYKDANPDVTILTSEVLYTDKGFLPRFPATSGKFSCNWMNRPWIPGYDGSLGFGGEFTEGDAPWFFPGFRYTFGNDKAVSCAPMGSYLIVGCENSIWYIPQPSAFPDASGKNGSLPNPVQLDKIKSGCTGFMLPVDGGVAYSSTVGGVWMITTNFQNIYMSRDIQDQLTPSVAPVTAMKIDANNRLHIATGTAQMFTYDQIVGTWYNWELPLPTGRLLALVNNQIAIQDNHRISQYDPNQFIDNIDGDETPIEWRIKFADFDFAGVRRFKHCWAFQILGEYLGPHNLFGKLSYPQDNWQTPTIRSYTPNSSDPYLAEINPAIEDASTYSLELYANFDGIVSPGRSASIELVSAAVGLESGQAQVTRRLL